MKKYINVFAVVGYIMIFILIWFNSKIQFYGMWFLFVYSLFMYIFSDNRLVLHLNKIKYLLLISLFIYSSGGLLYTFSDDAEKMANYNVFVIFPVFILYLYIALKADRLAKIQGVK